MIGSVSKHYYSYYYCCTAVVLFCGPAPPTYACTNKCIELRVQGTIPSVVFQNMITAVLVLCCRPVSPPLGLCLYNKCKKFTAQGTISSVVVCQNKIITAVL